ncbi:glycosyltransferase family 2 protein [Stenomitos frigidus]|uniref:Glycosyl transferase family 2 n=1 Tax=Stenomitos frigidus ULC18 TaxID=2107698 RepID=A0A2T1ESF5_9CYAN|nr:glycosyltransferase [Stenomitos frigidus]PSB35690.1 glycosyl transferase family 2 [Stenomitos frigidus ULC18]
MKLSVILPCFNSAATIAIQLEALAAQQWSGTWEVIVSNNGSTDDSMAIVERYRDRLPNLRIVNAYEPPKPRQPVAHSYNVGMQVASGDAFAFCESDDEIAPGWVAAMGEALSQFDFVAGRLEYRKLNPDWLTVAGGHQPQQTGLIESCVDSPPYLSDASGCNLGMTRRLYEAVGPLDTSFPYCYDKDYCWRAQLTGFKLHFVPDALIHYRLRQTPGDLYKQGLKCGKDLPLLCKRYEMPLGKFVILNRLKGLSSNLIHGPRLFIMSVFNIRRGRGGFAWWSWGLGYCIGEIQGLSKYALQGYPDQEPDPSLSRVKARVN